MPDLVRNAAELISSKHPLHAAFKSWVADRAAKHDQATGAVIRSNGSNLGTAEVGALTARQARKFLQDPKYAMFREPEPPKAPAPKPKCRRGRHSKAA